MKINPTIIIIGKNAVTILSLSSKFVSFVKTAASNKTTAGFANSEGCKLIGPIFIQRCAPFTVTPATFTKISIPTTVQAIGSVYLISFL